ncbi:MAG: hypothetical protein JWM11_1691, partial [Planctomycetaceae bacterium]|nr:hypothetical protein [Planctomycetaceae bacterium]
MTLEYSLDLENVRLAVISQDAFPDVTPETDFATLKAPEIICQIPQSDAAGGGCDLTSLPSVVESSL